MLNCRVVVRTSRDSASIDIRLLDPDA